MSRVTLTFDNGPEPDVTPRVLDILAKHGVRSTFFVLGRKLVEPGREDLARRAREIGEIIRSTLGELGQRDDRVGEIRGRGAMIAVEIVKAGTHEPDAALAGAVAKAAIAQGVIVLTCGTYGNVLRFLPPLTIEDALVREGLGVVAAALEGMPS